MPENSNKKEEELFNNYLRFAFPNGLELSSTFKTPIIYSIVLTNEKGIHLYLYILLFYEKIKENENDSSNILIPQNSEQQFLPISIIISSYYSNIDFFRKLLIEFYTIIILDFASLINNNEITDNSINNNNNYNKKISCFQK